MFLVFSNQGYLFFCSGKILIPTELTNLTWEIHSDISRFCLRLIYSFNTFRLIDGERGH